MKHLLHMLAIAVLFPAPVWAEDSSLHTHLSKDVLESFIKQHCVRCHGPKVQKGDQRLDSLSLTISNDTIAQSWQHVLGTLNAGNMPPEKEPQPTNAELTEVLGVLTVGLRDARRRLSEKGKAITVRRLNRREYSNTIKHLFGVTLVTDELPEDDPSEPFDTIGSQQYFSSYRLDKHLELGRRIVTDALK